MILPAYLSQNGLSFREFARRIGTPHARTVERYAKGQQIPNREMMRRIFRATNGEVTANDFFDLSDAPIDIDQAEA